MANLVRTNSDDADFRELVALLDADLAVRGGAEHLFYAQFNKVDAIRHVVLAYEGATAFGSPMFDFVKFENNKAILSFKFADGGLLAKDKFGCLKGFEIAGLQNARHFLIVGDKATIEGWLCLFGRNAADWFSMIVGSANQRKVYGSALLTKAKENTKSLNGWAIDHNQDVKSNGEPYESPLEFYTKTGFKTVNDERLENNGVSAIKILWRAEENK
jgi:GNAT superfamily N-acetyltransferase